MQRRGPHRGSRRDESGATLVEFALVAPIVFLMIFALIGGSYLAFQSSSLHDGATAGARMASIESSLASPESAQQLQQTGTAGLVCESDQPNSIEKAVSGSAPLVPVNPAPLCATSGAANELAQYPTVPGDVNIVVNCGGTCAAPTSTSIVLTYSAKGIVAPFGLTYNMKATSQDPPLSSP